VWERHLAAIEPWERLPAAIRKSLQIAQIGIQLERPAFVRMPSMALLKPHSRNLRKGRYSQAGCYYFLTTVVAGRRQIFTEPERTNIVLDAIRWLRSESRFLVDAAVVMPDHLHMAGQLGTGSRQDAAPTQSGVVGGPSRPESRQDAAPTQSGVVGGPSRPDSRQDAAPTAQSRQDAAPTLASVMHSLKSYSAKRLARMGVAAPVWQDGYHDHGLRDDEDYMARVRYLLQNPLRAGLARRVEEFPFVILPDWWVEE